MRCASEGEWRAYLDGELAVPEKARMADHLASCAVCQAETVRLRANASAVASALQSLAPSDLDIPSPVWSRVRDRADGRVARPVTRKWGVSDMFRSLSAFAGGSRLRIATSAITLFVAMVLLFAFTPAGMAAGNFLSIFRANKFVAVTVDPSTLPNLGSPADLGTISSTGADTMKTVTPSEAQQITGLRLPAIGSIPAGIDPAPRATMASNAHSVTFTPDIKKVRAYLSSIGASNVKLPDSLDGAPIVLAVAPVVSQMYTEKGGLDRASDGTVRPVPGAKFIHVAASTSPTLTVPDGIDVDQIRSEFLKMPGLPADLVNQLKAIDDWRNTVVIPVVKGKSSNVTVQSQPGLMIHEDGGPGATVIWQSNGVVYTITGNVSDAELLSAANSLK